MARNRYEELLELRKKVKEQEEKIEGQPFLTMPQKAVYVPFVVGVRYSKWAEARSIAYSIVKTEKVNNLTIF